MAEVDNMQKQMLNISTEIQTLRKNQKEILKLKNTVTEMKNTFDASLVDWTQPRKRKREKSKRNNEVIMVENSPKMTENTEQYTHQTAKQNYT